MVLDYTKSQYRSRQEKSSYELENDIKCHIEMTLWKVDHNDKKARDPSLIWRRLRINLLIKAEKKFTPHKDLDDQDSYDFAEFDSASRKKNNTGADDLIPIDYNSTNGDLNSTFEQIPTPSDDNEAVPTNDTDTKNEQSFIY